MTRLQAEPYWHMGKHIAERNRRSYLSIEKAVTCMREGERMALWTCAKRKRLCRANSSPPRETRYVLCHFRRSYLKAIRHYDQRVTLSCAALCVRRKVQQAIARNFNWKRSVITSMRMLKTKSLILRWVNPVGVFQIKYLIAQNVS